MKLNLHKNILRSVKFLILFISFVNIKSTFLNAEETYLKDIEIETSTKYDESSSGLPTNPFELVEMLRRANSMNDATNPSDAIDDALKMFNERQDEKNL